MQPRKLTSSEPSTSARARMLAGNNQEVGRQEVRRPTLLNVSAPSTTMLEENEKLNKYLDIYNADKLCKENAWSVPLIDTLTSLLERHHKTVNNFKVAGSTLEASSRVYSLRVDSIHAAVLRMSAGLKAKKYNNADDDKAAVDPIEEVKEEAPKPKRKRPRRITHTITNNKETINGRLNTVPLLDPMFVTFNRTVGAMNSPHRLMNSILTTKDSKLLLHTDFPFWNADTPEEDVDYTIEPSFLNDGSAKMELEPCDSLLCVHDMDALQLRPHLSGYTIFNETKSKSIDTATAGELISMAFDINADAPAPQVTDQPAFLDINCKDLEALTAEERAAINNCGGLLKAPIVIEDMRPVDANSNLEYSYRPLDKISQFWAGPSHWKFRRLPLRSTANTALQTNAASNQRSTRRVHQTKRMRLDPEARLFFEDPDNIRTRKSKFVKNSDSCSLKLPTDFQLKTDIFFKYKNATQTVMKSPFEVSDIDGEGEASQATDEIFGGLNSGGGDDVPGCSYSGIGENNRMDIIDEEEVAAPIAHLGKIECHEEEGNNTILEISNNLEGPPNKVAKIYVPYAKRAKVVGKSEGLEGEDNNATLEIANILEGAPNQVAKVIVPYAKRAKVIDMKNLKHCCKSLISRQMKIPLPEEQLPKHPLKQNDQYAPGIASFQEVYKHLPHVVSSTNAEALSKSVAFYSMLHLANDLDLRLIPQEDLSDFKIRQLVQQ